MRSKSHSTILKNSLIIITMLVFLNLASTAVVKAQGCTPSANEVALFEQENYGGGCVTKGPGEYRRPHVRGLEIPVRSVRVGSGAEALLCEGVFLHKSCSIVYRDTPTMEGTRVGELATTLMVRARGEQAACRPGDNQVSVWQYQYFFGRCMVLDVGIQVGADVRLPGNDPQIIGGSLRVGTNVEARLCNGTAFQEPCVIITPGYYGHWTFPSDPSKSEIGAIEVRRRNQPPSCVPGANQVAVYQYEHYVGPCRVFNIGDYSLNETLSWAAGLHGREEVARSFKVGDNVQATLCWGETHGGRTVRICARPLSINVSRGFRDLERSEQVSLTIQQRGATPPTGDNRSRGGAGNSPPAVSAHDFTVWLAAHSPFRGVPYWTGRYPTIGNLDGTLARVANPRNSVWLGFLKSGYGSVDCGNPDAYVLLRPGETMTADQVSTLFGSRSPSLPIQFVVCSGAVGQPTAGGGLSFPALPLNITYTRRR